MTTPIDSSVRLTSLSHGAGCACKLPLARLEQLMNTLGQSLGPSSGDLLVGAAEGDDAAVLRLDDSRALVLTTDFFTPIVDNPYDWGRIAATNALSDVYAMGGSPLVALNLAAWPGERLSMDLLAEVLRGGADVASAAGCLVVGGHTIDDPEPKFGMAVVGIAHPERLFMIDRAQDGDVLVLTKAIGTGVVATALKRGGATPADVDAAVASMTTLNAGASEAALAAGVRSATDITGFGLLGHLYRLLHASGLQAEIYADRVPLLPGAAEMAEQDFISGGTRANIAYLARTVSVDPDVPAITSILLHDAQTSGGMLLAAPAEVLAGLLQDLRQRGIRPAVIGRTSTGSAGAITVRATGPAGTPVA